MDFSDDHFALLGLPRAFRLDTTLLDARYRALQAEVHPDRFANAGDAERRSFTAVVDANQRSLSNAEEAAAKGQIFVAAGQL
ncbi:hypothetical protein [Propionivibrio sp.]|uniref:hypothetical protein n=1 Tax=Propionivibrio sp. TaxID=2212460 RepID=UPI00345D8C5E